MTEVNPKGGPATLRAGGAGLEETQRKSMCGVEVPDRQAIEKRRQDGLNRAYVEYLAERHSPDPVVRARAKLVWDDKRRAVFAEYHAALKLFIPR